MAHDPTGPLPPAWAHLTPLTDEGGPGMPAMAFVAVDRLHSRAHLVRPPPQRALPSMRWRGAGVPAKPLWHKEDAPANAPGHPEAIDPDQALMTWASAIPVVGGTSGLVHDLERGRGVVVPRAVAVFLTVHRGQTVGAILDAYPPHQRAMALGIVRFALGAGLAFLTSTPERFPPLPEGLEQPNDVTVAVVDVDAGAPWAWEEAITELGDLGCPHVLLRAPGADGLALVSRLLRLSEGRMPSTVSAHLGPGVHPQAAVALAASEPRLWEVALLGAQGPRLLRAGDGPMGWVFELPIPLDLAAVPRPDPRDAVFNVETFTQARSQPVGLYGRIHIDVKGILRLGFVDAPPWGPFAPGAITAALGDSDLRRAWAVSKPNVEGCQSCAYRFACVDVRTPTLHADGVWRYAGGCACSEEG